MISAKKNEGLSNDILIEEIALPPLEDDEILPADPESYADILYDDRPIGLSDDTDLHQITEEELAKAELLLGEGESNWIDGETSFDAPIEVEIEDPDDDWLGGENSSSELDTTWFLNDHEPPETETTDDGAEGLLEHEEYNLELAEPNEDWEEDGEDTESFDQAITRLGIDFPPPPGENSEPVVEVGPETLLGWTFLGPAKGRISAVAFDHGAPVAIGTELFGLGADGLLHSIAKSRIVVDNKPNSVTTVGNRLFVGTETGGCFTTTKLECELVPCNDWNTGGLHNTSEGVPESVSTSIRVTGFRSETNTEYVLGLTGQGHLFMSMDRARTWTGPLTADPCIAHSRCGPKDNILALTKNASGTRKLQARDLESGNWTEIPLPEPISRKSNEAPVFVSAHDSSILISVSKPNGATFRSPDLGQTWTQIPSLYNVTALTRDPVDPFFVVAASRVTNADCSTLKVSEDDGQTWKTAFVTGQDPDGDDYYGPIRETRASRDTPICSLAIDTDATRQILAGTSAGAYLITLTRRRGIH